jgi:hypothetical protein
MIMPTMQRSDFVGQFALSISDSLVDLERDDVALRRLD